MIEKVIKIRWEDEFVAIEEWKWTYLQERGSLIYTMNHLSLSLSFLWFVDCSFSLSHTQKCLDKWRQWFLCEVKILKVKHECKWCNSNGVCIALSLCRVQRKADATKKRKKKKKREKQSSVKNWLTLCLRVSLHRDLHQHLNDFLRNYYWRRGNITAVLPVCSHFLSFSRCSFVALSFFLSLLFKQIETRYAKSKSRAEWRHEKLLSAESSTWTCTVEPCSAPTGFDAWTD